MSNLVCVAVDRKYDDLMGVYNVAYLWDGEKVSMEGGIYQDTDYNSVTASLEERRAASVWVEANTEESGNYNKYARCNTYVGCVVTLKRSRKAPNKKPLLVVDFQDRYYSNAFRTWVDEKVIVLDQETDTEYTVSYGCINELVKGIKNLPFWYIGEKQEA